MIIIALNKPCTRNRVVLSVNSCVVRTKCQGKCFLPFHLMLHFFSLTISSSAPLTTASFHSCTQSWYSRRRTASKHPSARLIAFRWSSKHLSALPQPLPGGGPHTQWVRLKDCGRLNEDNWFPWAWHLSPSAQCDCVWLPVMSLFE